MGAGFYRTICYAALMFRFPLVLLATILLITPARAASPYFGIEIVDDQTGRGVPLVEVETVSHLRFDTAKQSYPLGLFKMAGAVADLPGHGGLDPSVGIDLRYFQRPDGFAREMAPLPDKGLVWIDGVMVLKDDQNRERMLAHASIMQS